MKKSTCHRSLFSLTTTLCVSSALVACQNTPATSVSPTSPAAVQPANPAMTPDLNVPSPLHATVTSQAGTLPGTQTLKIIIGHERSAAFSTQSFDCTATAQRHIHFYQAMVDGPGLKSPIYSSGADAQNMIANPSGCNPPTSVVLANVPVGKARVITIKAFGPDIQGRPLITGTEIRGVVDLTPATPVTKQISYGSSLSGLIISELLKQAEPNQLKGAWTAAQINTPALETFEDTFTGRTGSFPSFTFTNHPYQAQIKPIVNDLMANGGQVNLLNPANPAYIQPLATAVINVVGYTPNNNLVIYMRDPKSAKVATPGSTVFPHVINIPNVVPGNWVVEARNSTTGTLTTIADVPYNTAGTLISLSTFGTATWTEKNSGLQGGVINAVMRAPSAPATIYAATDGGGVFKSTNDGANWSQANGTGANKLFHMHVLSLAVDNAVANTAYAGTLGGGIYKTTDGGANWTQISDLTVLGRKVYSILLDGQDIYAGSDDGILEFKNANNTWSKVNLVSTAGFSLAAQTVSSVIKSIDTDGAGPIVPYYWASVPNGSNSGIYRAAAPGSGWERQVTGLTSTSVRSLRFLPGVSTGRIFAGTDDGKIFLSDLDAVNWLDRTNPSLNSSRINAIGNIFTKILLGTGGIAVQGFGDTASTGPGPFTWSEFLAGGGALGHKHVLSMDDAPSQRLLVGTQGGGVWKTDTASPTAPSNWLSANTGLNSLIIRSLLKFNSAMIATTEGSGVFASTNNGGTWSALNSGFTTQQEKNAQPLAVDAANNAFTGTLGGGVFKLSGSTWNAFNASVAGVNMNTKSVYSLAYDAQNDRLFAGAIGTGNGVYVTPPGTANWSPTTTALSVDVQALHRQPGATGKLLVGSNNGVVYVSPNNGSTWSAAIDLNGAAGGNVTAFGSSSIDLNILYASILDTDTITNGGVYRSVDGGTTWNNITSNLPTKMIKTLTVSYNDPNVVYAGLVGKGIYKTLDGGATWQAFTTGGYAQDVSTVSAFFQDLSTPTAPVLFAGLHGRGVASTPIP